MLAVANVLGLMLVGFSAAYILPILAALWYGDGTGGPFVLTGLASVGVGFALAALTSGRGREMKPRDGFLLVTLGWVLLPATATLPLLALLPHLTFTHAFFETM